MFSCPWGNSPAPRPSEPHSLGCPIKVWSPFSQVLQPMRNWDSSPSLIPAGSSRPPSSGPAPPCCLGEVQGQLSRVLQPVTNQRQLSCSHAFRASSPASLLPEPALPYCPDGMQCPLSQLLQLVGDMANSPTRLTSCPAS